MKRLNLETMKFEEYVNNLQPIVQKLKLAEIPYKYSIYGLFVEDEYITAAEEVLSSQ